MIATTVANSSAIPAEAKTPWARLIFLTLALLWPIQMGAAFPLQQERTAAEQLAMAKDAAPARHVALACLGAMTLLSLGVHRGHGLRVQGALGWAVLLYLGWSFASAGWSVDFGLSVRRLIVLAIFAMVALDVAGRFTLRDVLRLAIFMTGAYVAVSLFVELRLGSFRPLNPAYRFGGVNHPNELGVNCGIFVLAATALAASEKRHRLAYGALVAAAFPLLLLTRSRAALLATVVGVFVYWLRRATAVQRLMTVVGLAVAASLALLVAGGGTIEKVAILGRSDELTTLTGRVPVWQECLAWAEQRPVLGYGYESFWTTARIEKVSYAVGWSPCSAHSGYLDILLALGPVGLAALVLVLLLGMGRASAYFARTDNRDYCFLLGLLALAFVHACVESELIQTGFLSLLVLIACVKLGFQSPEAPPEVAVDSPPEPEAFRYTPAFVRE